MKKDLIQEARRYVANAEKTLNENGCYNKELKQYDNIHFFEAPMSKYGVGATEVYFR